MYASHSNTIATPAARSNCRREIARRRYTNRPRELECVLECMRPLLLLIQEQLALDQLFNQSSNATIAAFGSSKNALNLRPIGKPNRSSGGENRKLANQILRQSPLVS